MSPVGVGVGGISLSWETQGTNWVSGMRVKDLDRAGGSEKSPHRFLPVSALEVWGPSGLAEPCFGAGP